MKGKQKKIVLIRELENMVTFEWRTKFYVHYMYDVSCHSLFCLSLPLFVVFRGRYGHNHCNVFSLIISSFMQNSTNEE